MRVLFTLLEAKYKLLIISFQKTRDRIVFLLQIYLARKNIGIFILCLILKIMLIFLPRFLALSSGKKN